MRHEDLVRFGFMYESNLMSEKYTFMKPGISIIINKDNMTNFTTMEVEADEDFFSLINGELMLMFAEAIKIKDG